MIREPTLDDAAAAAELLSVVSPEFVNTKASVRHSMRTSPPEARRRYWCVEEDGGLVAWCHAGLVTETSEPGVAAAGLSVSPERRGRGHGGELLELAERHLRSVGAARVVIWSRDDEATIGFAASRGYERTSTADILVLDPRTVTEPELPPDVEVRPYATFADDPEPIHRVDQASMLDEPGDIVWDSVGYELWLERHWCNPLLDRELSVVALVEGEPVTVTALQSDPRTGRALNAGTGTLPEYRGRGLAMLAKRVSLARAAARGITTVYTGNDETNAPMQAINRRLGYRPCSTVLTWRKSLAATTTRA